MKIKDLIDILNKQDPEADVYLSYDSFCGGNDEFVIAKITNSDVGDGIHLVADCSDVVRWYFDDDNHDGEYEILVERV